MARSKSTTTRAVTVTSPAEQRAEQDVGRLVRRINERMRTLSRSMMTANAGTPFDPLKPSSHMPVVGTLGPQTTATICHRWLACGSRSPSRAERRALKRRA